MDPVGALIGTILIGLGTLVLYGAYKNRKVFGASGLLPTALSTGDLSDLSKVPEAFGSSIPTEKHGVEDTAEDIGNLVNVSAMLIGAKAAIGRIALTDNNLATQLSQQLDAIGPSTSRAQLGVLAQLLAIADAKGHKEDADIIRKYVEERTGESL